MENLTIYEIYILKILVENDIQNIKDIIGYCERTNPKGDLKFYHDRKKGLEVLYVKLEKIYNKNFK
jgi:hypothetical protein